MNPDDQIRRLLVAIGFAVKAHQGQLDKAGEPYVLHPLRVGISLLPDYDAAIAGVLHDVIEDTEASVPELIAAIEPSRETLEALYLLTRAPGDSYEGYIDLIKVHPLARTVKLADLRDNLKADRHLAAIAHGADPDHMNQLIDRYRKAREEIQAVIDQERLLANCRTMGLPDGWATAQPPK